MAGKSAKSVVGKKCKPAKGKGAGADEPLKKRRGRPAIPIEFEPEEAPTAEFNEEIFRDRQSADEWMRARLSKQVKDYDFLIDQLKLDLKANTKAAKGLGDRGSSELLRSRQSILTSMRTLMGGQQELMISLMKSRNLLGDLGGEDEGGDVIVNVQRLPGDDGLDIAQAAAEATGEVTAGDGAAAAGSAQPGTEEPTDGGSGHG